MKLEVLVGSFPALKQLGEQTLPVSLSFKISKAINAVAAELRPYEDSRKKLIDEYMEKEMEKKEGEEKMTGKMKFKNDEAREKFQEDLRELLDQETEISVPEIKIADLKDSAGKELNIAGNILADLEWLIK